MSFPRRVNILVVGGGPVGLTAAISLMQHGVNDVLVVDDNPENTSIDRVNSRAITIHAATLEILDRLGCVEPLIEQGNPCRKFAFTSLSSTYLTANFSSLSSYTKYPYVLLIPQGITEDVLDSHARRVGIPVQRNSKAIGLRVIESGIEVSLESGHTILARHVVGADGSRSTIRTLAGVAFTDPNGVDGNAISPASPSQLVLADITFTKDISAHVPLSATATTSVHGLTLLIGPLPDSYRKARGLSEDERVYRVVLSVLANSGLPPPPPHPPAEYLQKLLDRKCHIAFDKMDKPPTIAKALWSNRYRVASAVADTFLVQENQGRNTIVLVGDAAHVHPPAGGQGVNLGIRDAAGLGPAFAAFANSQSDALEKYTTKRRTTALQMVRATRMLFGIVEGVGTKQTVVQRLGYMMLWLLGKFAWVNNLLAWRLSGLADLDR